MRQHREHPGNCERAYGDTCRCAHCAGSQHGWVGAIQLIRYGTPEELARSERSAERDWRAASGEQAAKPQRNPKPTLAHKKAAVRSACANLIKWLRGTTERLGERHDETPVHPLNDFASPDHALAVAGTEVDRVEALGRILKRVLDDVEAETGSLSTGTRRAMTDHFWCELLVQPAVLVEEADHALDSVPDELTRLLVRARDEKGLATIEREVVSACVTQLWERLRTALGLTAVADAKALLPALRALGLLICKSPARHRAVVRHCVDPLQTVLVQETKQRLQHTFADLVPQITSDLTGSVQRGHPV